MTAGTNGKANGRRTGYRPVWVANDPPSGGRSTQVAWLPAAKAGSRGKEAAVKVQDVYRVGVFSVDGADPLSEAASRMQFNEIGSLAVFEGSRFAGIVTERDLVRALAEGADRTRRPSAST